MNPPYDLREMPEAQLQQEIRTMDDWTLHKAVDGVSGPKITHHQERTIKRELGQRRADDIYAAQLADEAQQQYDGDINQYLNDDTVDTLENQGTNELLDRHPDINIPASDDAPSQVRPTDTSTESSTSNKRNLSQEERRALLLIGAILYEAVVMKRTKDTIQAHLNDERDLYITDSSIPRRITEYLWSELSVLERSQYLEAIMGDNHEKAMDKIEDLCTAIGIDMS